MSGRSVADSGEIVPDGRDDMEAGKWAHRGMGGSLQPTPERFHQDSQASGWADQSGAVDGSSFEGEGLANVVYVLDWTESPFDLGADRVLPGAAVNAGLEVAEVGGVGGQFQRECSLGAERNPLTDINARASNHRIERLW